MKFGMRPIEEDILGEMSSTMRDWTNSGRDSERHITVLPGNQLEIEFVLQENSGRGSERNTSLPWRPIGNSIRSTREQSNGLTSHAMPKKDPAFEPNVLHECRHIFSHI